MAEIVTANLFLSPTLVAEGETAKHRLTYYCRFCFLTILLGVIDAVIL